MVNKSKIIYDINEIQSAIQLVKSQNRSFITNFYFDSFKHGIWIKKNKFELIWVGKTAFLIFADNGFKRLFFISPNINALCTELAELLLIYKTKEFVTDLVGKEDSVMSISKIFSNHGFNKRSSLIRMTSLWSKNYYTLDDDVLFANINDLMYINSYLNEYFDKYVEQLPLIEELTNWIDNKEVLICREEDKISGFLIFENTIRTAYLRYWFVHPKYREKKIGSKLIYRYFRENNSAKRFLFWVIENNENAIKRYYHYGFKPENLKNIVLTYNIDEYEKQNN